MLEMKIFGHYCYRLRSVRLCLTVEIRFISLNVGHPLLHSRTDPRLPF